MYSTIPIHWNIWSAPASPGRSRVGPALYEFSLLGSYLLQFTIPSILLLLCTVHALQVYILLSYSTLYMASVPCSRLLIGWEFICMVPYALSSLACMVPYAGSTLACMVPYAGSTLACMVPYAGFSLACMVPYAGSSLAENLFIWFLRTRRLLFGWEFASWLGRFFRLGASLVHNLEGWFLVLGSILIERMIE